MTRLRLLPRPAAPARALGACALLGLLGLPACTYLVDRGRDFAQMFRAQGGFGRGLGVTARAAGVADVGLNTPGFLVRSSGVGLVYGDWYLLSGSTDDVDFMRGIHDETIGADRRAGTYFQSHKCWALLPAVFARVDSMADAEAFPTSADSVEWVEGAMLWSDEALAANPWAHVHAFDTELGIYFFVVNAKFGFSPGEAVDFLAGIFGLDLAGDDTAAVQEAR